MEVPAQGQIFSLKKKNAGKKKQQSNGGDIVYTRYGLRQTIPSLTKRLKTVTEPIVGLQFVWEYRSPSRTVPPHYQCRLCKVQQQQNRMVAHVIGWKHGFRYLKLNHSAKLPHDEAEAARNPADKKKVKAVAAEVEKTEGRGQVKVVFKEPCDVSAFQNMSTAFPEEEVPKTMKKLGTNSGCFSSVGPLGGGFMGSPFTEDFSSRGGMMPDFHSGLRNSSMISPNRYDRIMDNPESMQRLPNSRSMRMSPDRFGMGQQSEDMGRDFPANLQMRAAPDSNSTLSTLLRCLDTFRIECEEDAQVVLKITQKLTDVLMEYRLRTISSGPSMNSTSLSMSSGRFSSVTGSSRFFK